MNFNKHWNLVGQHAFLGASKYHWIRYDDDKIKESYRKFKAVQEGTETHDFASVCIKRKQKLPKSRKTLNMFVNDAIGFRMESEQVLYYSDNCYGTADAISFRDDILRISDLKTGEIPAHFEQLMIYAALFCLEYKVKPGTIQIILKIYQSNEIKEYIPEADEILPIMDTIVRFDKIITKLKQQEA